MPTVFNIPAANVPAIQLAGILYNPNSASPRTSETYSAGMTTGVVSRLVENALRCDMGSGRYGTGGAYSINGEGMEITWTSGLSVTVAVGDANIDGLVPVLTAAAVAVTANTTNYLWLSRLGAIAVVTASTAPPAGENYVYLGRVTTNASAVTEIDGSGVVRLKGSLLWRRTADTTTPADAPSAAVQFLNVGSGKDWLWIGTGYRELAASGTYYQAGGTDVAIADGGTGVSTQQAARFSLDVERRGGYALVTAGSTTYTFGAAADVDFGILELDTTAGAHTTFNFPNLTLGDHRGWRYHVRNIDTLYNAICKVNGEAGPGVTVTPGKSCIIAHDNDGKMFRVTPDV